jgi:lipoprotein NlpI/rhodanese-related sulfurtransferase
MMQHILMLMWERAFARADQGGAVLKLQDYVELGGIGDPERDAVRGAVRQGALSDHADKVLASLTSKQRDLCCWVFRALTETQGGHRTVRRPASLKLLSEITDTPIPSLIPIIEAFRAPGRHFLTPSAPAALNPETMVDITHESLIRQWTKLKEWVADEHQAAETYRTIERRACQWKAGRGNALTKLDLAVARKWLSEDKPNTAWAQRYGDAYQLTMDFLKSSTRKRRISRVAKTTVFTAVPAVALLTIATVSALVKATAVYDNPAGEWSNFNVAPQRELLSDSTNSPPAVPGGRIIGTAELELALESERLNGVKFFLIDVYERGETTKDIYIPKSTYMGYAGRSGQFNPPDEVQKRLKSDLAKLTNGDRSTPLVFFCSGASCPNSYNAVRRSSELGYTNVYWYRGGIRAWQSVNQRPTIDLSRVPPLNPSSIMSTGWTLATSAVDSFRSSASVDDALGRRYLDGKRFDHALDTYERLIKRDPENPKGYLGRARTRVGKDETGEAVKDFTLVIDKFGEKLGPSQLAPVHVERGDVYMTGSQAQEALNDYKAAECLNPEASDAIRKKIAAAHAMRAELTLRSNASSRFDEAMKDLDTAIAIIKDNADFLLKRAKAYAAHGAKHKESALRDFNEVVRLAPKSTVALQERARFQEAVRHYVRAIMDFDAVVALAPTDKKAIRERGLAHFYGGNFDLATMDFVRVMNSNEDDSYTMLFRYLSRVRSRGGPSAGAELGLDFTRISNEWPKPVFEMFLDKRSIESVLNTPTKPDDVCEAFFYVAQKYLMVGDQSQASPLLRKAASVEHCKVHFWEHKAAKAELKRLEK